MRLRVLSLPLLLALLATGTPSAAGAQARRAPLLVTRQWLAKRLGDTSLVLVHVVTDRAEYDAGHIPGSVPLPVGTYAVMSADSLRNEMPTVGALQAALTAVGVADGRHVVVIGVAVPAARLAFTMAALGLESQVSVLDGGIEAWREGGTLPVTRTAGTPRAPATLTLHPDASRVATIADVQAVMAGAPGTAPRTQVLDARAVEFYTGASAGSMPRAGHVPGAGNVPLTSLTGVNGAMRETRAVRPLLERAGARGGDRVITYCHTGMQASLLWLHARLAGYEARVFDGSWQAWSRTPALPVEGAPAQP
ncbi:MAG: sulfurtransferase [Gemmatimonadaceae bacterium]|nr:sulfurtransferase [Gemmatimonadaceae bacterium]